MKPTVRVWAYVGPEAPLGGAKVKLRDRDGKVVAQARTTRRGTYEFRFRGRSPKLPLTATTYGGRAAGKAFTGNMQARVFSLKPSAAVTQLSVISTAASRMSKSSSGYSNATKRVRRSMKIHAGALAELLVLAPQDDTADAEALADALGARWTQLGGPTSVPDALSRVLLS